MTYAGTTVTLMGPVTGGEQEAMIAAWATFEDATGITIDYSGAEGFEELIVALSDAGTPPDLAMFPQPGLLADLARAGALVDQQGLAAVVERNYVAGWVALGSVDGTLYAVPFGANLKSLVWYAPSRFAEAGYEIPDTWSGLLALSDQIVSDGAKPWCVGMESGDATGWVGTDWIEDLMLRTSDAATYDAWIAHTIPFDSPEVIGAFDEAAKVLKKDSSRRTSRTPSRRQSERSSRTRPCSASTPRT